MIVTAVRLNVVTTPRHAGLPSQHVLVRLETDAGITGVGEMPDLSHLPAMMPDVGDVRLCLEALLVGSDTRRLGELNARVARAFPGSRFGSKSSLVRCGVDLALHDLAGKALGVPVYRLLGGKRRDTLPVCYPIFRMKSTAEVEPNLARVAQRVAGGFAAFRVYVGGCPEADEVFVAGFVEQFGERARLVALDASGRLSPSAFVRLYRRLERFPFDLVESVAPRDDLEGMAWVRGQIGHPVSEHIETPGYALAAVRHRAVDIFNISVSVAGGIEGARRLFAVADAAGAATLIGTTQETGVATAAQAHLGVSAAGLEYWSDPVGPWLYTADVIRTPLVLENGGIRVPEGPGLGVELDEDQIERLEAPLSAVEQVRAGFARE